MPGYVIHLATAKKITEFLGIEDDNCINQFMIGNIIPDVVDRRKKKESHFWSDETYRLFVRKPDVKTFLQKYKRYIDNPFVAGYYAHIYMDAVFIDEYWQKKFSFYDKDMHKATLYDDVAYVLLEETGKIYNREQFFSDDMYYGDYDRMNTYIINRYNIKRPVLSAFPTIIEEIDCKTAKPALEKMIRVINPKEKDEGIPKLSVFKLDDIEELIEKTAERVISQINI